MMPKTMRLLPVFAALFGLAAGVFAQGTAPRRLRVACVGDTITFGYGISAGQSYPDSLARLLGDGYEVRNFGASGTTLSAGGDNPYARTAEFLASDDFAPDVVVIFLGTNDAARRNAEKAPRLADEYKALIAHYRTLPSRPIVLICRPSPLFEPASPADRANLADGVLPAVDRAAAESGVETIDVNGALAGQRDLFQGDGIHPTARGAQVIARRVMSAVTAASPARREMVARGPGQAPAGVGTGTTPRNPHHGETVTTVVTAGLPASSRPGRFRLGPFYLTPRLRLGNVGVDTNVLYTPTDRRADVIASGGPGLEIVLPLGERVRFSVDGGTNYLYFVRTSSQRRLVSEAKAELKAKGVRTEITARAAYIETYGRPTLEVDRRVAQTDDRADLEIRRHLLGRFRLVLDGAAGRTRLDEDVTFLGTDLRRSLSRETVGGGASLEYALTPRTRFKLRAHGDSNHFLFDAERDGDLGLAAFGIETDATTLVSGYAEVGEEIHRWVQDGSRLSVVYASVDATWHPSRGIGLGGGYRRDLGYTVFEPAGGPPILYQEAWRVHATFEPIKRLDLRLTGSRLETRSDRPIRLELGPDEIAEQVRVDRTYEGGADLGYRVLPRLRLGVSAVYAQRRSTFADLGVHGLLLGGTVLFTP
jgi:lysophospholipase L1-like esterase